MRRQRVHPPVRSTPRLDTSAGAGNSHRMSSPGESPFQKYEPVGRSARWVWLAVLAAVVMIAVTVAQRVTNPESSGGLPGLAATVVILGGVLGLLVRAARITSLCRRLRNFETMARALRAQRRFWIAATVFGVMGLLGVIASWWVVREKCRQVRNVIDFQTRTQQPADAAAP